METTQASHARGNRNPRPTSGVRAPELVSEAPASARVRVRFGHGAGVLIFGITAGEFRHVQRRRHHQLDASGGLPRHHRRRRVSADDRRRIRSLDRFDDRIRRYGDRHPSAVLRVAGVAGSVVRIRVLHRPGLAEWLSGHQDPAAVLHRHARLPVHPARADSVVVDLLRQPHDRVRHRRARGATTG